MMTAPPSSLSSHILRLSLFSKRSCISVAASSSALSWSRSVFERSNARRHTFFVWSRRTARHNNFSKRNSISAFQGASHGCCLLVLFENFFSYQGKTYVQTRGIPQGSILGCLLCSFYLNTVLGKGHFIRYVDDILILGDTKDHVQEEAGRLLACPHVTWNLSKLRIQACGEERKWCGVTY